MLQDFGTDSHALSGFIVSVYTIGYCIGPLITSPASELYGRVMVIYPSFMLFLVCLAVCGESTDVAMFIVFQGLMGCAGITFMISGGAIVADMIPKHRRGLAQSFLTSGPTLVSDRYTLTRQL